MTAPQLRVNGSRQAGPGCGWHLWSRFSHAGARQPAPNVPPLRQGSTPIRGRGRRGTTVNQGNQTSPRPSSSPTRPSCARATPILEERPPRELAAVDCVRATPLLEGRKKPQLLELLLTSQSKTPLVLRDCFNNLKSDSSDIFCQAGVKAQQTVWNNASMAMAVWPADRWDFLKKLR